MNKKNQQKNSRSPKNDAKAFKAAIAAIEECRNKPSYDYQRIILCQSNRAGLGLMLARHSGGTLVEAARVSYWANVSDVLIIENAGDCGPDALESIVFLVNQTRGVVVLVAGAQGVDSLRDQWREISARIQRRTHLTIEFDK
jgi:hypothetical protein